MGLSAVLQSQRILLIKAMQWKHKQPSPVIDDSDGSKTVLPAYP